MKFLGIETEILGNNETLYYILKCLKDLEKNLKIYLNPEYIEQFYFVIALHHDIINLFIDKDQEEGNTFKVGVSSQNSISEKQIIHLYSSDIKEEIHNKDTIEEALDYASDSLVSDIKDDMDFYIDNYGIFMYNSYRQLLETNNNLNFVPDSPVSYTSNDDLSSIVSQDVLDGEDVFIYDINEIDDESTDNEQKNDDESKVSDKNEIVITCIMKGNQMLKINLLVKELVTDNQEYRYNSNKLKLIKSFFIDKNLQVDECNMIKSPIKNRHNMDKDWRLHGIDKYFNFKDVIGNYTIDYFEKNDIYLEYLIYNKNGYYFNQTDIGLYLKINEQIFSNVNHHNIFLETPEKFKVERYFSKYRFNFKPHRDIDKIYSKYIEGIVLMCDVCGTKISKRKRFYSSIYSGDCCEKCFEHKKHIQKLRITHIKKQISLIGKRVLFRKDLAKMKEYLATVKPRKLSISKKIKIMNDSLDQYKKGCHHFGVCKICLDVIDFTYNEDENVLNKIFTFELNKGNSNISIGSLCGHAFHTKCLEQITGFKCPFCRTDTRFTRLCF